MFQIKFSEIGWLPERRYNEICASVKSVWAWRHISNFAMDNNMELSTLMVAQGLIVFSGRKDYSIVPKYCTCIYIHNHSVYLYCTYVQYEQIRRILLTVSLPSCYQSVRVLNGTIVSFRSLCFSSPAIPMKILGFKRWIWTAHRQARVGNEKEMHPWVMSRESTLIKLQTHNIRNLIDCVAPN